MNVCFISIERTRIGGWHNYRERLEYEERELTASLCWKTDFDLEGKIELNDLHKHVGVRGGYDLLKSRHTQDR